MLGTRSAYDGIVAIKRHTDSEPATMFTCYICHESKKSLDLEGVCRSCAREIEMRGERHIEECREMRDNELNRIPAYLEE